MNKHFIYSLICIVFLSACTSPDIPLDARPSNTNLSIFPDYKEITVPCNIASLNFKVLNEGDEFLLEIDNFKNEKWKLQSDDGVFSFKLKKWKKLLSNSDSLQYTLYVNQVGWVKFPAFTNYISKTTIDPYISYRKIDAVFNQWGFMGIFQRNIENFKESAILTNRVTKDNCMNCHVPKHNSPDSFIVHFRGGPGTGMLLKRDGEMKVIDTKTNFNSAPAAYTSWHPSGKYIASSFNKLFQFFHDKKIDPREVVDINSNLLILNLETNEVLAVPEISNEAILETFPEWSADGKKLYFCTTRRHENMYFVENYDKVKFSLMSVDFDIETEQFSNLDTVISGEQNNMSFTMPRVSMDGKYIALCGSEYGNFPVFIPSSDVYLYDIKNDTLLKPSLNSDQVESFHYWSSNSQWLVVSSKRYDGVFSLPYFAMLTPNGETTKPFLLPQKEPDYYDSYLYNYNRPTFLTGKVKTSTPEFIKTIYSPIEKAWSEVSVKKEFSGSGSNQ
jgi:hypothetical protein